MLFSCKCLNVVVQVPREHIEGRKTPDLHTLLLLLPENAIGVEQKEEFFKQVVGPVETEIAITKAQSALIQTQNIEDWVLNRCLNCKVTVYACNDIKKSYLVNLGCRTTAEEAEKLRASTLFSPVFHVAMVESEFTGTSTDLLGQEQRKTSGDGAKSRINELEWTMHQVLLAETAAVEERVRLFKEQQVAQLKMQRLRAEQEFHTLCNVINSVPDATGDGGSPHEAASKALMETPPATPDNTPMSIGNSPPLGAGNGFYKEPNKMKNMSSMKSANNNSSKHSNKSQGKNQIEGSIDADGIFDMDGMGDNVIQKSTFSQEVSDAEESDHEVENHIRRSGGGVQIPRAYSRQSTIAKSLPISMPIVKQQQFQTTEDDFDELPEDSNVDIAASIKALARSVHGEAIFGDLPRPRRPKFVTDI